MIPKEQRTKRARQLFDQVSAKPPYRVPLMTEINEIEWNGLGVVSLFAGFGGSSLGYRMAGFRVLWANEFVPIAQESYRANMREGTILDGRDVREVTAESILKAIKLKAGELDLLDGSPPCQAFSTAGKREKGWGTEREYAHGAKQKNEDLFFEYVRIRDGLMPRAFVAENVSGLVKGKAKGYFIEILRTLKKGYRVEARILDAQWLGVPQQRQRIIFVGVRDDIGLEPAFPIPLPYRYSVRDALPWLGRVSERPHGYFEGHDFDAGDGPMPTVRVAGNPGSQQVCEDARIVKNKNAAFQHKKGDWPADQVAPTVMGRRPNIEIQEPVIRTGRNGSRRAREENRAGPVDIPASAVLASGGRNVEGQFMIEYRGQPGGKEWQTRTRSIDEPSAAVTKDGYGAAARHQAHIVERLVQGPEVDFKNNGKEIDGDTPAPAIAAGNAGRRTPRQFMVERVVEPEADISEYAIGAEYDRLNPGQQSDKYFNLVRASATEPSPTVMSSSGNYQSAAAVMHPTEKRRFSIAELKRICSAPDDVILKGTYGAQWERLGNSVPPIMMMWIASAVRDKILLPAREARKCMGRPTKGSGQKSKSASQTNAGPGRHRSTETATATSTLGRDGSHPRKSSPSKKS